MITAFVLLLTAIVAAVAWHGIQQEQTRLTVLEHDLPIDPLAAQKRHGCLVAIAAPAFAAWLVLFTFAYDNPTMGRGVPSWVGWVLGGPVAAADILGIYATPFVLAVGLAGRFGGQIPSRWHRIILACYTFLFTCLAASVVIDAWYPRRSMGELSTLWVELSAYALAGEALFVGLLVLALRAPRMPRPATN